MLAGHLNERGREKAWEAYMAQMLWYANQAAYHGEFKHPTWLEIEKKQPEDTRTGRQIVDDLVAKLRARQEMRKRGRRE